MLIVTFPAPFTFPTEIAQGKNAVITAFLIRKTGRDQTIGVETMKWKVKTGSSTSKETVTQVTNEAGYNWQGCGGVTID